MAQPGYPPQPQGPAVNNNLTMSIVSLFFFWPLAIPAIINASRANDRLAVGDVAGAQAAATESKKWSKWALIIGIGWWVIVIIACCGLGGLSLLLNRNS
jgi:hypothetical protein